MGRMTKTTGRRATRRFAALHAGLAPEGSGLQSKKRRAQKYRSDYKEDFSVP